MRRTDRANIPHRSFGDGPEHIDPEGLRKRGVDRFQTHEKCGFTRNIYKWAACPNCVSNNRRQYALSCNGCGKSFYATEKVDLCPECGSGNTRVVSEPENPLVR